jgi:hypothetical protein
MVLVERKRKMASLVRGRPGPKRKANVLRDRSGKSRGERPEEIMAVALAPRIRRVGLENAVVRDERTGAIVSANALSGYTLGILLQRHRACKGDPSGIDEDQCWAGNRFAGICKEHAIVMGYEQRPLRSARLQRESPTTGFGELDSPREVSHVASMRDQFRVCYDALMRACAAHGLAVRDITYAVCIDDLPVERMRADDFGNLRLGLNALARALHGKK